MLRQTRRLPLEMGYRISFSVFIEEPFLFAEVAALENSCLVLYAMPRPETSAVRWWGRPAECSSSCVCTRNVGIASVEYMVAHGCTLFWSAFRHLYHSDLHDRYVHHERPDPIMVTIAITVDPPGRNHPHHWHPGRVHIGWKTPLATQTYDPVAVATTIRSLWTAVLHRMPRLARKLQTTHVLCLLGYMDDDDDDDH